MKVYKNISEYALTGAGWLLRSKEFGSKDVVSVDDVRKFLNSFRCDNIKIIKEEFEEQIK